MGPLLDRFDKRGVFVVDSVVRAAVVAAIPLTAALSGSPGWLPFVVAACHGLFTMVPLAGFPPRCRNSCRTPTWDQRTRWRA